MVAKLLEGVAGSGKTTYIADYACRYGQLEQTLLITFSRTGRDVMVKYMQDRGVDPSKMAIYTIDGLAARFLYEIGDTYSVIKRESIETELLPSLLDDVLQTWPREQPVNVPAITPRTMSALLNDIDFYRAADIDAEADEAEIEQKISQHLNHDWRLVQRLMWAYDRFRATWVAPNHARDGFYEETSGNEFLRKGELGFRQLSDAVYDLLEMVHGSNKLAQWGRRYRLICIDEFHDTSPVQLQFLLGLARGAHEVLAVGDRFQNIYAWRGSNTAYVFDEFVQQLQAERRELNQSYRYGTSVAEMSAQLIQRTNQSLASHRTEVVALKPNQLNKLSKEGVVICQDSVAQVEAAFYLWRQSKHKLAYAINHTVGTAILNILLCIRYAYLLPAKSPIFKNLTADLAQFLALPHCQLNEAAKQELLNKPNPQTLGMYFSMHTQANPEGQAAYSEPMRLSLLQWLGENRETQSVYEIMQWFEQSSRLWTTTDNSMASAVAQAAWQALKQDAQQQGYTLAQWPEQYELLCRAWSERAGIRLRTVSQAKGREYDEVLVFNADKEGFIGQEGELARNQFYIAMTRTKKKLYFLALDGQATVSEADNVGRAQSQSQEQGSEQEVAKGPNTQTKARQGQAELSQLEQNRSGTNKSGQGKARKKSSAGAADPYPMKRQALSELAKIKAKILKRVGG